MDVARLSLRQLDELIARATEQLRKRQRSREHVLLMLQAALALDGYGWYEVFPEVDAPWTPADEATPPSQPTSPALLVASRGYPAGATIPLTLLQERAGLAEWSEFYALLDIAVRQGLFYFRGREHVCLTDSGSEAVAACV